MQHQDHEMLRLRRIEAAHHLDEKDVTHTQIVLVRTLRALDE